MKNLKRMTILILALAMALSLTIPGFAADTSFTDVASDAWYAGAVEYVVEHELMNGTGNGQFSPEADTSRAMLVTILWRMEGEPVVNYLMQFPDVAANDWYTEGRAASCWPRWPAPETGRPGCGSPPRRPRAR